MIRFKPVLRYAASERKFRLFRIMWERGHVGDGKGYSAKLAVAVQRYWLWFAREPEGWRVIILGLCVSYKRSYGGVFA